MTPIKEDLLSNIDPKVGANQTNNDEANNKSNNQNEKYSHRKLNFDSILNQTTINTDNDNKLII